MTCTTCTSLARTLAQVRGDRTHLARRLSRFRPDQLTYGQRTMLDESTAKVEDARQRFADHQRTHTESEVA